MAIGRLSEIVNGCELNEERNDSKYWGMTGSRAASPRPKPIRGPMDPSSVLCRFHIGVGPDAAEQRPYENLVRR
jgi:hypothetical protein